MAEAVEISAHPVTARLAGWNAEVVAGAESFRGELTITVARAELLRVADFLRHDSQLQFDFLSSLTATDHFPLEPRFAVVYELLSLVGRQTMRLRTWAEGANHVVPSVTSVWPTANWHEREVFDLFGIRFEGHPELTRILCAEDWVGHPLRKDYEFPLEYHGICGR